MNFFFDSQEERNKERKWEGNRGCNGRAREVRRCEKYFQDRERGVQKSDTKVSKNGCEGKRKHERGNKTEHGRLWLEKEFM